MPPTGHDSPPTESRPAVAGAVPEAPDANELLILSWEECLELLEAHHFGRVAVVLGDGIPVIRPVNYLFDRTSGAITFRTALGSKFHALTHAPTAAFEIDAIDPATATGWSVIARGRTDEVTRRSELSRLERLELASWAPGEKAHWLRVRISHVSGRRIVTARR